MCGSKSYGINKTDKDIENRKDKMKDKTFEFDIKKVSKVPVEEIGLNDWNPKKEDKKNFEKVKKSLETNGFASPLLVREKDGKYEIIDGQHRFLAAKELGYKEVYVYNAGDVSDEEAKAMTLWMQTQIPFAEDLLAPLVLELNSLDIELPYTDIEIESFREKIEVDTADEVEEVDDVAINEKAEAKSEYGKVYKLGNHRLMCGDSTSIQDVSELMNGEQADLLLTDPPYNVAYEGGTGMTIQNDNMDSSSFRQFLVDAFTAGDAVLKEGACIYIWHAGSETIDFREACKDVDWHLSETLIWVKSSLMFGRLDYHYRHEPCLYLWKKGAPHKWYGDRKQTTCIEWDKPDKSEYHPTMKPVGLFAYQMENSTKKGDNVLDLFGGSGTTIMAAEQLGRRAFVMELDPKYCDAIRRRYQLLLTGSEEGWEEATPEITGEGRE